jgi:hypothetical protein
LDKEAYFNIRALSRVYRLKIIKQILEGGDSLKKQEEIRVPKANHILHPEETQ